MVSPPEATVVLGDRGGRPGVPTGWRYMLIVAVASAAMMAWHRTADSKELLSPGNVEISAGYQTIEAGEFDAKLRETPPGFPGMPQAALDVGMVYQWRLGEDTSPWRVGIAVAVGFAESAGSGKEVRLVRGYVGPRAGFRLAPMPGISAEMAIGVGLGASALTLVHDDISTLQEAMTSGHESTIWRLGAFAIPELVIGAAVTDRTFVRLSMGYVYDLGLGAGWRSAGGAPMPDAPREGLNGPRYRLSVSFEPPRPTVPRTQSESPWITTLGAGVVSLDPPTASRLLLPDVRGAQVVWVAPGSPAERAGLRQDDIIRRVGSVEILSAQHLQQELARYRPGDWIQIRVWRVKPWFLFLRRGTLVDLVIQAKGASAG